MDATTSVFASESRISPRAVSVGLILLGGAIWMLSASPPAQAERARVMLYALTMWLAAIAIWQLDARHNPMTYWLAFLAIEVFSIAAVFLLGPLGVLFSMMVPVVMAAALLHPRAALVAAIAQSVAILLFRRLDPAVPLAATAGALAGIWLTYGSLRAIYGPLLHLTRWVSEHYEAAQVAVDEARNRREEFEQTLEDLARANQQLTRLNVMAQGFRQAADDARLAKEQFVANVSHELRTPLNMITGFSEIILESPGTYGRVPPALLADLSVIHRNAEHLAGLIDDVLDLSQIEANRMALSKEPVAWSEIVDTAVTAVRPLFESKGLYLEAGGHDKLTLLCDRTRMREVMINLLSNAGRFTEQGGVRVESRVEDGMLRVSVADTGRGIAADDMSRLFRPFEQVDGLIRRRYGGTGLGLALTKQFVELHQGKIWVESQVAVGTTFTFQIPIGNAQPVDAGPLPILVPGWEYHERTRRSRAPRAALRPRMVTVESGDGLSHLVTRYADQIEVVHADSIEAALDDVSRVPAQALLVNDVSVSKMLDRVLSSPSLPSEAPTIICSIPGKREEAGGLGVAERLVKPIARDELLGALDHLGCRSGAVLIVDDEPDALHLFGRMLASAGRDYRSLLARDGCEALSILADHRPDVILLDLIMPNMDGIRFLEVKNQDPALRDIPVIVTSARDPAGQPIVSNALAVTKGGGLSATELLASIEALSAILSPSREGGDRARPATPAG